VLSNVLGTLDATIGGNHTTDEKIGGDYWMVKMIKNDIVSPT